MIACSISSQFQLYMPLEHRLYLEGAYSLLVVVDCHQVNSHPNRHNHETLKRVGSNPTHAKDETESKEGDKCADRGWQQAEETTTSLYNQLFFAVLLRGLLEFFIAFWPFWPAAHSTGSAITADRRVLVDVGRRYYSCFCRTSCLDPDWAALFRSFSNTPPFITNMVTAMFAPLFDSWEAPLL
ncbi:hypothetical protein BJ546DRAFT_190431 [Cryomyces antarcticus]